MRGVWDKGSKKSPVGKLAHWGFFYVFVQMIFAKKIGNLTRETEIHVEVTSWLHNCCRMPRFKWRKDMFVRAVCQSYASYVYQLTCTTTLIWANFFFAFVKFLFELLHFYHLYFERLENEKCLFFVVVSQHFWAHFLIRPPSPEHLPKFQGVVGVE